MGITLDIEDPPGPTPDANGGEGAPTSETPPPGKSDVVGDRDADPRWTPQDVRDLMELVKQAYRGAGSYMGGDAGPQVHPEHPDQELVGWMEITDTQARMIAVPMTWWMPVHWIRGGGTRVPLIVGIAATAIAVGAVTKPKMERYARERRETQREPRPVREHSGAERADAPGPGASDAGRGSGPDHQDGARPVPAVRTRSAIEYLRAH